MVNVRICMFKDLKNISNFDFPFNAASRLKSPFVVCFPTSCTQLIGEIDIATSRRRCGYGACARILMRRTLNELH